MAEMQPLSGPPPHFIVIVPGYMGSLLRDKTTGETVWVDFSSIPLNPLQWRGWIDRLFEKLAYPNDDLEPAGIMNEVIFVPPWAKQEHYGRLLRKLEQMGYHVDPKKHAERELNVYTFAYDWRQDNRKSGQQLGEAIERWSAFHPGAKAWLLTHSNGGIISRWYIEKEGGKERVGRLFLFASPWEGAPKALHVMFSGFDMLFRRGFNVFDIHNRTRDLVRTFPSAYQLLPVTNPFLKDMHNQAIDLFSGASWLVDEQHRQYLQDAQRFNEELGTTLSVETLCFFGRKKPTTTAGIVRFKAAGNWREIEWTATEAGDGTVPERSAVHPHANVKIPFAADHGNIYVNDGLLEILEWELIGKYGLDSRADLVTEHLTIQFLPDRDVYAPGEEIQLRASVVSNEPGSPPFTGASVRVQMLWHETLPGQEQARPTQGLPQTSLNEITTASGQFEGQLKAPDVEGYYRLQAIVSAVGEPTLLLDELIAVEAEPGLQQTKGL